MIALGGRSAGTLSVALVCLLGCAQSGDGDPRQDIARVARAGLEAPASFAMQRSEEAVLRATLDPRAPADARTLLGPDPTRLVALPGGGFVALLGQSGEVVLLSDDLVERARAQALPHATALAFEPTSRTLYVGAATSPGIVALQARDAELMRRADLDRPAFARFGVRALAVRGACLYAVDAVDSVFAWSCGGANATVQKLDVPRGPVDVAVTDHYAAVTSPVGHTISVFRLSDGMPDSAPPVRLMNDGPFFGSALLELGDGSLFVAAGGVENRPLDRSGGSFGYVDSFLYGFVVAGSSSRAVAAIDVGEHGVTTPKAIALAAIESGVRVELTGYGSGVGLVVDLDLAHAEATPTIRPFAALPGVTSLTRARSGQLCGASPLVDAFVRFGERGPELRRVASTAPTPIDARLPDESVLRLGEALFYTNAMGPFQTSAGELSRFTCETCHFEGGIDGRVHRTGRADTTATTKPLFGLVNNGPHFTRALDDDLSEMVFAEFGVAAANTGHDSWFDLEDANLDWVEKAGLLAAPHGPADLRRALVLYLAALPHAPNPRATHARFSALEQRGQKLFAARCESCHAARLFANDATTRVPESEWEALVLSREGPIVWARDGYEATGIEPRVHPDGARPSSLRRIVDKTPYFTNGSAPTLAAVLAQAGRSASGGFLHGGATADAPLLDPEEQAALLSFLELL